MLTDHIQGVMLVDKHGYSRNGVGKVVVTLAVKAYYELCATASAPYSNTEAIPGGNALVLANEVDFIRGARRNRHRLQGNFHIQIWKTSFQNYSNFRQLLFIYSVEPLIEFIKILVPASLVLYAAYLLVRSFVQRDLELKKLEVRSRSIETILPNRLQAYERMTLFLERISPQNLLIRLNTTTAPSREFHQLLLQEIRNEYNHNVSQQVYMSERVWELIKSAKEDLIVVINEAASSMTEESTSTDLARRIFELMLKKEADTIGHAISELKKEIQQTF